jgi:hypothetical protein
VLERTFDAPRETPRPISSSIRRWWRIEFAKPSPPWASEAASLPAPIAGSAPRQKQARFRPMWSGRNSLSAAREPTERHGGFGAKAFPCALPSAVEAIEPQRASTPSCGAARILPSAQVLVAQRLKQLRTERVVDLLLCVASNVNARPDRNATKRPTTSLSLLPWCFRDKRSCRIPFSK